MCRSITTLRPPFKEQVDTDDVRAAALQYVRKVSGYSKPSRANEAVFEAAVEEIAEATERLLGRLTTSAPPRDREAMAERARARAAARYATEG